MIIGVVSDTHIPVQAPRLPEEVVRAFGSVDLILHAGDLVSLSVYEELQQLARVEAVAGNMDDPEVAECLSDHTVLEVEGMTIGLTHGWGGPFDLPQRVRARFRPDIDCIVFGHSHVPYNNRDGKTLLFNPGSPVFSSDRSFGILTVQNGSLSGEIIHC